MAMGHAWMLAGGQGVAHTRSMPFHRARIVANAASRGRASVAMNNNRNNASLPRAGD